MHLSQNQQVILPNIVVNLQEDLCGSLFFRFDLTFNNCNTIFSAQLLLQLDDQQLARKICERSLNAMQYRDLSHENSQHLLPGVAIN